MYAHMCACGYAYVCACMFYVYVCVCAYVGTYVPVCMYTETKEGHLVSYSVTLLYSLTELGAPIHLFVFLLAELADSQSQ